MVTEKQIQEIIKMGVSKNTLSKMTLKEKRAAKQQNAIPEFTSRFEGIFELEKLQQAGMAIEVPSIAEYITS